MDGTMQISTSYHINIAQSSYDEQDSDMIRLVR